MFVPLPNLDDRRWADLVDEGRSLIPVYAPAWTDHNAHDPGITLLELLAWIAETDIYRVDQIPDSHVRAFLSLIGIVPLPPSGARAVVELSLEKTVPTAVSLPATAQFSSRETNFQFRSRHQIAVQPASLVAVQVESGGKFRDVTGDWQRGKPISLFGDNPKPGDSFYLGFDPELSAGADLSLYFELSGEKAGAAERQRLLDEMGERGKSNCGPLEGCGQTRMPGKPPPLPPHHSVQLEWEVQTQPGVWRPVQAKDSSRSFSLSGSVVLTLHDDSAAAQTGSVNKPQAYLRARLVSGLPDAAPIARRVLANAVEVEQYSPVAEVWTVAKGVVAVGMPPLPGGHVWLYLDFDASGDISSLEFASKADDALFVRMLNYQPATNAHPGQLTVEAKRAGTGTGAPHQAFNLHGPQVGERDFELYALEASYLRRCRRRENLRASRPADFDFVLDAGAARVQFGDGQNGRVPPADAILIAVASETVGAAGNVAAKAISTLDGGPHNTALLGDPGYIATLFERIENVDPAAGGADAEPLAHAEGRAVQILQKQSRAVTLGDCEALALETPGTNIARATALANQHPGFQCYSAPGFITLVIVPSLPLGRPMPSPGLLSAVSAYLKPRQVIGTRIEVTGPQYVEIVVKADVKVFSGQSKTAVATAVSAALRSFFDPLHGGPDGSGWPLGGDVYVSEVVEVIAAVPGVDHVSKVELIVPGCEPQCGNVCLAPLALTVSGEHEIKVS